MGGEQSPPTNLPGGAERMGGERLPARRGAPLVVSACVVAACVAALVTPMGCAEILGVNGSVEDAVDALCKCDALAELWPSDDEGNFYACGDWVRGALESDPQARQAWLQFFDEHQCDECSRALECAGQAPLCIPLDGGPCTEDAACCGYAPGTPSSSYCGTVDDGSRRCVTDETACVPAGEACATDEACCGFSGGRGKCDSEVHLCLRLCDGEEDPSCPSCCARLKHSADPPEAAVNVCLDTLPFATKDQACEGACTEGCATFGTVCMFRNRMLDEMNGSAFVTVSECQVAFPQN